MRIPQLRILAISFCGRRCLYCRPTGEGGTSCPSHQFVDFDDALRICRLYKQHGGSDVKVSGGDPVFWPCLVDFLKIVKTDIGINKVEVITRSPQIVSLIDGLVDAGLDVLNFSLDTVNKSEYEKITGCYDFDDLIAAICFCAERVPVKINTVIMKGINDLQIGEMIDFCESVGVRQLKLLDIIDDLNDGNTGNQGRLNVIGIERLADLYVSLFPICEMIRARSIDENMVYQSGLGHPMNEFKLASGLTVTVKNSENGAWYGNMCERCPYYPCHDALMALRLTSDNKLQYCLLNEEASVPLSGLSSSDVDKTFEDALSVYKNAYFVS